jgi:hypothetical protein
MLTVLSAAVSLYLRGRIGEPAEQPGKECPRHAENGHWGRPFDRADSSAPRLALEHGEGANLFPLGLFSPPKGRRRPLGHDDLLMVICLIVTR